MTRVRFAPLLASLALACILAPPAPRADAPRPRLVRATLTAPTMPTAPASSVCVALRREALAAPRALLHETLEQHAWNLPADRFAALALEIDAARSATELLDLLDEIESRPSLRLVDADDQTDRDDQADGPVRLTQAAATTERLRRVASQHAHSSGGTLGHALSRGVWMPSADGD